MNLIENQTAVRLNVGGPKPDRNEPKRSVSPAPIGAWGEGASKTLPRDRATDMAECLVFTAPKKRGETAKATPRNPPAPTEWTQHLMEDANSSQLTNFPFALTAFVMLMTGLIVAIIGAVVISLWWSGIGLVLTLVGGTMYGCSLCDK
jgi:hypothetical protein